MSYLTVSDVARRLGVRPRDVSDLFYQRRLSDDHCPVVGGRRLIPSDYLEVIVAALVARGLLIRHQGHSVNPPQSIFHVSHQCEKES